MAEIKIQEKKRPIWPWIVLLLLIAAVVAWYLMENRRTGIDNDTEMDDTTETGSIQPGTEQAGAQREVDNFIIFVRQNDTAKTIKPAYVREGLDHLNSTIKAVITEKNITDSSVVMQSDSLARFASDAEDNEVKQSNNVRSAFISAANIIEVIQENEQPGLKGETDDLLKKASSIDVRETLTEQSAKVKDFFSSASAILQSMINKDV